MPLSTAATFSARNTKEAGASPSLPAGVYDFQDTAPGTTTNTTTVTYTTTTAGQGRRIHPFVDNSTATSAGAVNTPAAGQGWRLRQATDVGSTSSAQRIVAGGAFTFALTFTTGTYAVLPTNPTYGLVAVLFKISTAGVSTEVGRGSSTSAAVAQTTTATFTAGFNLATDVVLGAGETFQVEYYLFGAATANALGTVTNNVVTILCSSTGTPQMAITGGLRTRYIDTARIGTTTAVATVKRASGKFQSAAASVAASLGPRTISKQTLAATATGMAIRITLILFSKNGTATAAAQIQKTTGSFKLATSTAVAAQQNTVGVFRTATAVAATAINRQFGLAPKVATATTATDFSRFVNFVRGLSATSTAAAAMLRQVSAFKSASATATAAKGQTVVGVNRATTTTAVASTTKALVLTPKNATATATAGFAKFLTAARQLSASATTAANMFATIPQSVLARMVSGGGGTVVKKIINYIFDD